MRLLTTLLKPGAGHATVAGFDVAKHHGEVIAHDLAAVKHGPFAPIMVTLLFTFVFGGAIASRPGHYLVFLLPGIIGQKIAFASVGIGIQLNADMKGSSTGSARFHSRGSHRSWLVRNARYRAS